MPNRELRAAWEYHEGTKHSPERLRTVPHFLDWANQPMPFKVYTDLDPIPLPPEPPRAEVPALAALLPRREGEVPEAATPVLETLARMFFLTAGVTKRIEVGGTAHYFRAAPCTGALYHIEVYLVCGELAGARGGGLPAGVYHLAVHDYAARLLRQGDLRALLARACGEEEAPPAALVFTSTYWRNAWKYRARAYRHCFWDGGVMLANLLAAARAFGFPARVAAGFADDEVNALLGVDPEEEAALFVVELGRREMPPPPPADVPAIRWETMPLSPSRVAYPEIAAMHEASSLADAEEVRAWREPAASQEPSAAAGDGRSFPLTGGGVPPSDSLDAVILRRGSARHFERRPIDLDALSRALRAAADGLEADFLPGGEPALNEVFLIVSAVEGLPAGAYRFNRPSGALELLCEGVFRREAGHLGLDQALAADAAVNVYFLANLERVLTRYGNRGYRAAQLEAGLMGGRLYLTAYAQRLAATGLTFYDDEVTSFFGPAARGKEVMFLVLLGQRKPLRAIARG